jgi:ribosomal protein S18 acetylase RimI-like enzyme
MAAEHPTLTEARSADLPVLRRMLFEAWLWDAAMPRPDYRTHNRENPRSVYLDAFGRRPGDAGFIARDGPRGIGAAWYRLTRSEHPGYGFVAAGIPEVAIGIVADYRGAGLGRRLLESLVERARTDRFAALSLSVSAANEPARRLYRSVGFVDHRDDRPSLVMVLELRGVVGGPAFAAPP